MRKRILVVAQTPPPMHGQAVMAQYFLDGEYKKIELHHVRMAFSATIAEVGGFRWHKMRHLLILIVQIIRTRLQTGADVLYYSPASPNLVPFLRDCAILISVRWLFKKTVFHFHATGISALYQRLPLPLKALYRIAYSRPDLSLCLTDHASDDARHVHSKQIEIVPNGIPDLNPTPPPAPGSPHRPLTILFLATVSIEKGVGIVIEAIGRLRSQGLHLVCNIAGPFASTQDEAFLRAMCLHNDLTDSVFWLGSVSGTEKSQLYLDSDIFCFPTHYSAEGFPVVLLEAMMFGLPVIATQWRGIPDIVDDGTTGYLVSTHDPIAVAQRIEQLHANPDLRRAMGRAGRIRYEDLFTVQKFRERMESVLEGV